MEKNELEEILSDEEFVNELLNLETGREVKRALAKKGIKLEDGNLDKFAEVLADELEKRIKIRKLDNIETAPVSGGSLNQGYVPECILTKDKTLDVDFSIYQKSWILNHRKNN